MPLLMSVWIRFFCRLVQKQKRKTERSLHESAEAAGVQ